MKILVTGHKGFIGQHLTHELLEADHYVLGADLKTGYDLRNRAELLEALVFKPDVVVHLAAKVGRLFGEDNVAETIADNAGMTATVAQTCGERGIRLVYASTSEVYGDQGDLEQHEDALYGLPHNSYGLSKRWGEEACELYAPVGLTVWRISMPYGPGLPAGRGRAAIINMLDQARRRAEIPVHRGSERSWCWIGDTVRAMRLTIERTDGGVFNIGRDDARVSMFNVARMACNLTGAPHSLITEVDPPARQTVVKRLSTEKIRALGWEPRVDLLEGMLKTLRAMTPPPKVAYDSLTVSAEAA